MSLMNVLQKLWSDERGQSTTEYILILSVVVMVAIKFKGVFQQQMSTLTNNLNTQMDSALQ